MGFSRQGYWSELPFPFPGDLPYSGIETVSPPLQADSLPSEPLFKTVMKKLIVFLLLILFSYADHFESFY